MIVFEVAWIGSKALLAYRQEMAKHDKLQFGKAPTDLFSQLDQCPLRYPHKEGWILLLATVGILGSDVYYEEWLREQHSWTCISRVRAI